MISAEVRPNPVALNEVFVTFRGLNRLTSATCKTPERLLFWGDSRASRLVDEGKVNFETILMMMMQSLGEFHNENNFRPLKKPSLASRPLQTLAEAISRLSRIRLLNRADLDFKNKNLTLASRISKLNRPLCFLQERNGSSRLLFT